MSDETIFVRIEAEDYANVVTRLFTARRRLRECERAASEAAGQWTDELRGVLEEFNGFRRAVQEGLGFDQPELYHDNELIQMIRSAVMRAHLRRPLGVTMAEATAGAETVIRATLGQVVPVEGQPFRLEQTYKVEEPGSGGQDGGLRCGEDTAPGRVCDEPVLDGHCPVHGEVGPPVGQRDMLLAEANDTDSTAYKALSPPESDRTGPWSAPDDGPPTESMPPVGPNVPGVTGKIIADSDDLADLAEWPRMLATRNGDVYQYQNPRPDGQAEYHCFALMSTFTLAELLTMHGRVWIVDPQTGTDEGTVTS